MHKAIFYETATPSISATFSNPNIFQAFFDLAVVKTQEIRDQDEKTQQNHQVLNNIYTMLHVHQNRYLTTPINKLSKCRHMRSKAVLQQNMHLHCMMSCKEGRE